jgi:hypothetical protein
MAEKLDDRIKRAKEEGNAASQTAAKLQKEINKLLEQQDELSTKISAKHKKQLKDVEKQLDTAMKQYKVSKQTADNEGTRLKHLTNYKKMQDASNASITSFKEEMEKMNPLILKQIEGEKAKADIYNELGVKIAELEGQSAIAGEKEKARIDSEIAQLKGITSEIEDQAKATVDAQMYAKGMSESEVRIAYLKAEQGKRQSETNKLMIHGLHVLEAFEKKQEIIAEIEEKQKELLEDMPESVQGMLKGIKGFYSVLKSMAPALILLSLIGMAAEAFFELDEAAEKYRKEGGMTVKQTEHLVHQVHEIEMEYRKIGVTSEMILDVANDLGNTFSDVAHFSTETLTALSSIVARTGTTSKNAATIQALFEQTAGVSSETAANMQLQTAALAQQAGVSPKEVLDDIAESAEKTSKFFRGDVVTLAKQAVQAHRLGTTLDKMADTAENLLNFESSIEDELVAATFVGGQFNLTQARSLAYAGDLAGATEATLDAIQQSGDFSKQDLFTKQALAKAANMSISDIEKELGMRKRLAHLSEEEKVKLQEAMDAGLDISKIKDEDLKKKTEEFNEQQKINGQVTDMANEFKGIIASVGGQLMPIIQALVPVIQAAMAPLSLAVDVLAFMVEHFRTIAGIASVIAGFSAFIYANELKTWYIKKQALITEVAQNVQKRISALLGIQSAVGPIAGSLAQIPFGVGLLGLMGIVGGMYAMFSSAPKPAADINSPAGGQTMVHTKEGGLFKLSKNYDLVAAPGASNALRGGGGGGAGMGAIVSAIVGLRNDMAGGKIGVYMDGSKVTAGVAGNAGQSTRNNYAFT